MGSKCVEGVHHDWSPGEPCGQPAEEPSFGAVSVDHGEPLTPDEPKELPEYDRIIQGGDPLSHPRQPDRTDAGLLGALPERPAVSAGHPGLVHVRIHPGGGKARVSSATPGELR